MSPKSWSVVLCGAVLLAAAGCGGLLSLPPEPNGKGDAGEPPNGQDAAQPPDTGLGGSGQDAGSGDASVQEDPGGFDGSVSVKVEPWIPARSRPGARYTLGFRAWRGGLAARGERVFWVESGAQPGVYSAEAACPGLDGGCAQKMLTLTRPSAFFASATELFVADTTVLRRVGVDGGVGAPIASYSTEIVNLAAGPANAFWTGGTATNIFMTPVGGGTTNTPIYSNGTPIAMGVAADRIYWVGVDISGLQGALQTLRVDGTGAREVSRFSGGFHALGGNATYLYYAKDSPGTVRRLTVATGRDELIDSDAMGVTDFALDDAYAYWTEPGGSPDYLNGRVRRVAHDATKAETLADSIPRPVAIAVAGRVVYVASAGTAAASYADGAILRITLK